VSGTAGAWLKARWEPQRIMTDRKNEVADLKKKIGLIFFYLNIYNEFIDIYSLSFTLTDSHHRNNEY